MEERRFSNVAATAVDEARVVINRVSFTQAKFDDAFDKKEKDDLSLVQLAVDQIRSKVHCSKQCCVGFLTTIFPILTWLPQYKLGWILPDVVAGLTVGFMHIPQGGMAYGRLCGLEAVNGLYTSFFPNLCYIFLGTSRHISLGTFAVIALMISSVRYRIVPGDVDTLTVSNLTQENATAAITPVEVTTSLCLLTGFILLGLGLLRLGFMSVLLSDQVVGGFMTGAAVMVLCAQLGACFGLNIKKYAGPGKLYFTLRDIILDLHKTNIASLVISLISGIFLYLFKEYANPHIKKLIRVPFPIDLLVMILATGISYGFDFAHRFNVAIVQNITIGIPAPVVPRMDLMPMMFGDAIAISIVTFVTAYAMAKTFATKHNYPVDANQELVAFGLTEVIISFFNCFPASSPLARTMLNESSGARTQFSNVVGALVVMLVLLVIGPLFEALPQCILSVVIIVALKGMLIQVKEVKRLWPLSRIDCAVWFGTFLATCALDMTYGLVVGVLFVLLSLALRTRISAGYPSQRAPRTEMFINPANYHTVESLPNWVYIFRYDAPLCFVNVDDFKQQLLVRQSFSDDSSSFEILEDGATSGHEAKSIYSTTNPENMQQRKATITAAAKPKAIILDCSAISFIDIMGVQILKQIRQELKQEGIVFSLAACCPAVLDTLAANGLITVFGDTNVFPSVADAVSLFKLEEAAVGVPQQSSSTMRL